MFNMVYGWYYDDDVVDNLESYLTNCCLVSTTMNLSQQTTLIRESFKIYFEGDVEKYRMFFTVVINCLRPIMVLALRSSRYTAIRGYFRIL